MYLFKTYFILIVQVITITFGFIYRISHVTSNHNKKALSNVFLCINTLDGILFPLSYCLSNGIFTHLFCNKNFNVSTNSMLSEGGGNNNAILDESSSSSHRTNEEDKTFAMVDVKYDNNFDLSYYNIN